jgi:hypothetical protein
MLAELKREETPGQVILRHQASVPVNVEGIANDLGVNVWEMWNLPDKVSGKIFLDPLNGGTSGYSIGLNANEGFNRRRFTLAHEIAHFILHRHRIGNEHSDDEMYRSKLSTSDEVEANKLAARILMPKIRIQEFMAQGVDNPLDLSQKFQVSPAAMRVRLGYLGL